MQLVGNWSICLRFENGTAEHVDEKDIPEDIHEVVNKYVGSIEQER